VHSRRVLGAVALGAIVVAAISFAVVDASIAAANGCMGSPTPCEDHAVPVVAVTFSVLGMLSLLVSIVPAVTWIIEEIQVHSSVNQHSDLELARRHRARRVEVDDFES
jgi:hypothetical protein